MSDRNKTQTDCISAADILLPQEDYLQRWAVVACDQFTSQPQYWDAVKALTGDAPSAFHLILPESELDEHAGERIRDIHATMLRYLREQIFRAYPDCFVYTERSFRNGKLRCGLIGKVDLEQYDYSGTVDAAVRATEETVSERIPARMAVRRGAALELPHILLLCNDERRALIEPLGRKKAQLPKLYDIELMQGGGRAAGWLVTGEEKDALMARLHDYEAHERRKHPDRKLLYAVGDGNHSLATAKACYEELKQSLPASEASAHPARFALCELNNIHDGSQMFEPIHRIVKHCDAKKLIRDLNAALDSAEGTEIPWVSGENRGVLHLADHGERLPLSILQEWLDRWLCENRGELDYIHGEEALTELERDASAVGFRLPAIPKESLFPGILSGGVLPRKTFSMGEAEEKRYYLEARKIL